GPGGCELPCAVPDSTHGVVRRLSDRRPVQPVRVLRGAAGGVLRLDAARFGTRAGVGGSALHHHQLAGFVVVPDWRGIDLRGNRHFEPG
nr:hypothetical protein [Tanacetum cinerariifolium]